jgi:hypothetical protein
MKEQEIQIGCSYRLTEKMGGGIMTVKTRKDLLDALELFDKGFIEPIVLDSNELVNFGFESDGEGGEVHFKINENFSLCVFFDAVGHKDHGRFFVLDYTDDSIEGSHTSYIPNPTLYVHELQNLYFALTGEELTYIEPKKDSKFLAC